MLINVNKLYFIMCPKFFLIFMKINSYEGCLFYCFMIVNCLMAMNDMYIDQCPLVVTVDMRVMPAFDVNL